MRYVKIILKDKTLTQNIFIFNKKVSHVFENKKTYDFYTKENGDFIANIPRKNILYMEMIYE